MCLAVPHTILELLDENTAIASVGPSRVTVRTDLIDHIREGDTVLVHAGYAIERMEPEEGDAISDLLRRMELCAKDG